VLSNFPQAFASQQAAFKTDIQVLSSENLWCFESFALSLPTDCIHYNYSET